MTVSELEGELTKSLEEGLEKYKIYNFDIPKVNEMINREIEILEQVFSRGYKIETYRQTLKRNLRGIVRIEDKVWNIEHDYRIEGELDLVLIDSNNIPVIVDFKISTIKDNVYDKFYFYSWQWVMYMLLEDRAKWFEFHVIREDRVEILRIDINDRYQTDMYQELFSELLVILISYYRCYSKGWNRTLDCYDYDTKDKLCPFAINCLQREIVDREIEGKLVNIDDNIKLTTIKPLHQSMIKTLTRCPKKLYYTLLVEQQLGKERLSTDDNSMNMGSLVNHVLNKYLEIKEKEQ